MTDKIALARRMRALAGRETTDVNTTRGIAIVTRMRLARASTCAYTANEESGTCKRIPELRFEHRNRPCGAPGGAVKTDEKQYQHVWIEDRTQVPCNARGPVPPTISTKNIRRELRQESFRSSCCTRVTGEKPHRINLNICQSSVQGPPAETKVVPYKLDRHFEYVCEDK